MRATGADIIALQEVFLPAHRRFLIHALRDTHPHVLAPRASWSVLGSGLMLLSAVPLCGGFVRMPGVRGGAGLTERGALWAELGDPEPGDPLLRDPGPGDPELDGDLGADRCRDRGTLRLVTAHLRAGRPSRHAAEVMHLLRVAGGPAILLGDFNCGPVVAPDAYRRILNGGFADAYAATGMMEAPTWDAANPLKSGRAVSFQSQPENRSRVYSAVDRAAVDRVAVRVGPGCSRPGHGRS